MLIIIKAFRIQGFKDSSEILNNYYEHLVTKHILILGWET